MITADDQRNAEFVGPLNERRSVGTQHGFQYLEVNAGSRLEPDQRWRVVKEADVCFAPESGHVHCTSSCLLWAISRHCSVYSITSSARLCTDRGTVMPSVFAVLRLMISSIFVTCCTGRSAGFSPLRMRPV